MKFRRSTRLRNAVKGPDLAPMADIVFLLLIFFMISSSFVIQPGIELKLPETVTEQKQLRDNMVIIITSKEEIYLDNEVINIKRLKSAIKERLSNYNSEDPLVIKADKDVKHGLVVRVMDIAKQSGVKKLAVATDKKDSKQ